MIGGTAPLPISPLGVPDPGKSDWQHGDKTQEALAQKALSFKHPENAEPSLYCHFMPDKSFCCSSGLQWSSYFRLAGMESTLNGPCGSLFETILGAEHSLGPNT
jgi:hypothetical protein